jgi:RNA polymerase sigma-70 factor, ECF subfamily
VSTDLVPLLDEEQSDQALIEAHRAGAHAAFDILCHRYHARLVDMLIRRTRDRGLAEDLAQETLLRAYQSLDTFDDGMPVWPWMRTIATNLATDHGRSPAGRSVPTEDEPLIVAADEVSQVEDPSDQLGERQLLTAALSALNPRQRAAIGLRYLHGWSVAEVGRVLGMEANAVAQLLMRSRRRLCAEYKKIARDAFNAWVFPLLLPYYALRDRLARLRDGAVNTSPGPAMASAEALATTAAVGALTAAIAVGSLISPSPSLAEVTSQSPDRITPVSEQSPAVADAPAPTSLTPTASDSFATTPAMPESAAVRLTPSTTTSGPEAIHAQAEVKNDGGERTLVLYEYDTGIPVWEDGETERAQGHIGVHCEGPVRERTCDSIEQLP